jgi:hypothetical protein
MAEQAKVTSLDALESFRAALIVFLTKARQSTDEVRDAVRRTKQWVERDQPAYWTAQLKTRRRALDQATQELFSARLSEFIDKTPRQQVVRKCKAAVDEAEEKLRNTKKWNQNFEATADPLTKRLESLRQFLDDELPKGVAFLSQAQLTLEAYSEVHHPSTLPPPTSAESASQTSTSPEAQP